MNYWTTIGKHQGELDFHCMDGFYDKKKIRNKVGLEQHVGK